jgi:glutathione S-transferase
MIDLYFAPTPNGLKITIALEELGLPYKVHRLDLAKGEQKQPEYLAINPNGKIPAIVDSDGPTTVFESGAILIYLGDKTGRLLPATGQARYSVLEWLMFQMSAVGPMFGQVGYFTRLSQPNPGALERFTTEAKRISTVLDGQLARGEYLAGDYSIADIATYPWVKLALPLLGGDLPRLKAWVERVGARPAVQRGLTVER